jgi:hypothetical protein
MSGAIGNSEAVGAPYRRGPRLGSTARLRAAGRRKAECASDQDQVFEKLEYVLQEQRRRTREAKTTNFRHQRRLRRKLRPA